MQKVPRRAATMTAMPPLDLREEWRDVRQRRAVLGDALSVYDAILEAWAHATPTVAALAWSAEECARRWSQGRPLLADAPLSFPPAELEPLLGPAMDTLASLGAEDPHALQRFADAWDRGEVEGPALFPTAPPGSAPAEALGLGPHTVAFLACASLRPALEVFFGSCRAHLDAGSWDRGVCPFCGAAPGFADIVEDGRRRLACHVCGGGWIFARLRCPFCGTDRTSDLARLELQPNEEGYSIAVCKQCRAYVKELDRRVRWNGGSALVEDWGSPHFDVIARRQGFWRPAPPLLELVRGP
jgi:FdhE protein